MPTANDVPQKFLWFGMELFFKKSKDFACVGRY
jgi:hypothetical protein